MFLKFIGVLALVSILYSLSLSLSYPRVCVKVCDDGGGDVDLQQLVQFPNDPRLSPCSPPSSAQSQTHSLGVVSEPTTPLLLPVCTARPIPQLQGFVACAWSMCH